MISQLGSGDGLVLSGNKPLPKSMLTDYYEVTWLYWTTVNKINAQNNSEKKVIFLNESSVCLKVKTPKKPYLPF